MSKITIDRSVVEQALKAFEAWDARGRLRVMQALRAALEQPKPSAKYSDVVSDGGMDPRNTALEQPQVEQKPVAWRCFDGEGDFEYLTEEPSEETRSWSARYNREWEPLYTHPQNLNCKSNQARLATLWGYEKPQPPRQPLTDQQIHDCFQHRHRDKAAERRMITRAIEFAHGITGEQE